MKSARHALVGGDLFEFVWNERTKRAEFKWQARAPTGAMYVLHLYCWRTRSISRYRSMLASHRRLYRVTASHGHFVLFHTGDGD
jgi:hypothetical protein